MIPRWPYYRKVFILDIWKYKRGINFSVQNAVRLTLKLQSLKLGKFEKWRVKNRVIRKTNTHEAEVQSSRENSQVSQCACAPSPKLEFRKMVSIYFLPDISEGLIFFLAYLSTRPKTLLSFRSCGSSDVIKQLKTHVCGVVKRNTLWSQRVKIPRSVKGKLENEIESSFWHEMED